jgi:hypothetical protein
MWIYINIRYFKILQHPAGLSTSFIRGSAIYDNDFENYEDEFLEDFDDDASIGIDEYDMGSFRDSILAALLSWLFLV